MSHDGEIIWQNELSENKIRIISERTSLLMSAILQRAVREGTGVAMRSVYEVTLPLAAKTGTSQDNADAWFAAFNPSLVMVSRVGASLPSVHFFDGRNGSGSALALPLVAITLKNTERNMELRNRLFTPFPLLPPYLAAELECPDYKEKKLMENVIDFFKRDKITFKKDSSASEIKKQTIFQRIFGKKKKK
jgi:penicillin-binding protein 1A